jgi:hypothetical protein
LRKFGALEDDVDHCSAHGKDLSLPLASTAPSKPKLMRYNLSSANPSLVRSAAIFSDFREVMRAANSR